MIQYKDIWYKDDGALTRVFCEDGKSDYFKLLLALHMKATCRLDNYFGRFISCTCTELKFDSIKKCVKRHLVLQSCIKW